MAPTDFHHQPHAGPRYAIRGELDGTWTVYDVVTGVPAVHDEQMLVKLTFDLADVMLELLVERDARRERGPWGARIERAD
jgi:hypothetical protein